MPEIKRITNKPKTGRKPEFVPEPRELGPNETLHENGHTIIYHIPADPPGETPEQYIARVRARHAAKSREEVDQEWIDYDEINKQRAESDPSF